MCGAALARRRPIFAAALCLAFHCLLRVDELLSIRLVDWKPALNGRTAVLSLPRPPAISNASSLMTRCSFVGSPPFFPRFHVCSWFGA